MLLYALFLPMKLATIMSLSVCANSGAGSGMAGMVAAIPICHLVWQRRTNPMKFGQLILRKII